MPLFTWFQVREGAPESSDLGGPYLLIQRIMDDEDLEAAVKNHAARRQMRRVYHRWFMSWVREYEREIRQLTLSRARASATAMQWDDVLETARRGLAYGRISLHLRLAAYCRLARIGKPLRMVRNCISDLRQLDQRQPSFRSASRPIP